MYAELELLIGWNWTTRFFFSDVVTFKNKLRKYFITDSLFFSFFKTPSNEFVTSAIKTRKKTFANILIYPVFVFFRSSRESRQEGYKMWSWQRRASCKSMECLLSHTNSTPYDLITYTMVLTYCHCAQDALLALLYGGACKQWCEMMACEVMQKMIYHITFGLLYKFPLVLHKDLHWILSNFNNSV